MANRRRVRKSFLLRILVLGVSVYMVVTLVGLWNTLSKSKAELSSLEAQKESTQADIDELKSVLSDGTQKKLIEKAARQRLGFVYPYEEIYVDFSGN